MASLAAQLMTVAVLSLQRQLYHNRGMNRTSWNATYDFIVVGGGTSGAIVAGRLSENPDITVLLLEAGGPLTITSDIVPTFYWLNYNWGYYTVPQRNAAFGLNDRRVPVPRGKILGGSHAINFAAYTRGNWHDYDNWAYQHGATDWNYREVLPYFLKSENNTDPAVVAANPQFHSTSGPIELVTQTHRDPIINRWLDAVQQLGWPITADFGNMVNQFGAGLLQTTQSLSNWTRQTTASGFIEVNIARPNLHVLLNAHVTRVLFNGQDVATPTVTGVEFVRNNRTYQVLTNREVILSAGSINTPQILMLSGIGPREHLTQLSIPLVADLPVGSNLYEHMTIPFDFLVTDPSDITWTGGLYFNMTASNLYSFLANAAGSLTQLPMAQTYIATDVNGNRDWPDANLYLLINQLSPSVDSILDGFNQADCQQWRQYYGQFENDNRHLWLSYCLFRPLSTGTVRLASRNAFDAPLIDPAYFSNKQDLVAIVKAMHIGFKIVESPLLSPYLQYSKLPIPGCQFCVDKPLSECYGYLACVAQTLTLTTFHPVGSCKMGNATSTDAVVDERLRVRGVANLRVIDSSIMPVITNANTNAPSMMIGEKGAALVKQDHGLM